MNDWPNLKFIGSAYDDFSAEDLQDLLSRLPLPPTGTTGTRPDKAVRCADCRTPVFAQRSGVVSWLSPYGPPGNLDETSMQETVRSRLAHLSTTAARAERLRKHCDYLNLLHFRNDSNSGDRKLTYSLFATGRLAWDEAGPAMPLIALCPNCPRMVGVVSQRQLLRLLHQNGAI